jgi:hypothetical protein
MKLRKLYILLLLLLGSQFTFSQNDTPPIKKSDTSNTIVATSKIYSMLKKGKPPKFTLQLIFGFDIGHLDLASDENTYFRRKDFENGGNFGTRYGYGAALTGKLPLHKAGNIRLNVTAAYNRLQSNYLVSESPEGKVYYNVFSGALGIENNFSPAKRFKPFVGFDINVNMISGNAVLKSTDSADVNVKILNSVRFGLSLNLGTEYAFNNSVGFNLGYKITFSNILGKQSKASSSIYETYLNDDKVTSSVSIPYAGWKQFLYSTFYAGINFYFGMKNKK